MSTGTTLRRHKPVVADSVSHSITVVPADVHAKPAANREVASEDDTSRVDPLWMITAAFVLMFALLAILSAS